MDARNQLENAIYQAEKMPDEYKDKVSDEDAKVIKEAVAEARKVLSDEKAEREALEEAAKELSSKIMPIGAKLYQSGEKGPEDPAADKSTDASDDAVEGEVVDK